MPTITTFTNKAETIVNLITCSYSWNPNNDSQTIAYTKNRAIFSCKYQVLLNTYGQPNGYDIALAPSYPTDINNFTITNSL